MLKIFDLNKKYIGLINDHRNLCVESLLETGRKSLSFELPLTESNISLIEEEMYIQTKDYEYIIKEVNYDDNNFLSVYCSANIESIIGKSIAAFDALNQNLTGLLSKALDGTGWTALISADCPKRTSTYQLQYTSSIEMVEQIREDYDLEYYFNTLEKKLYVYVKMGSSKGAYFSNQLNLRKLVKQTESYNFATRIIPIGKDGLTIEQVNNGKIYLDNNEYSKKIITKYWVQEEYTVPELLKADAEKYLNSLAIPRRAYKIDLSFFGKEVGLGDTLTLVDNIKKIKEKQRVVKIIEYPQKPELNKVELSNLMANYIDEVNLQNSIIEKKIAYVTKNLKDLTDIVINK